MIQTKNNEAKRATICQIDYVLNSMATVKDYPGDSIRVLTLEWVPIKFSTASFIETNQINGEFVIQELTINVTGMDQILEKQLRDISGQAVLVRLKYTSSTTKVVGTEENPVLFEYSCEGSPVVQTLISKRNSAEKAKYLTI